MIIGNHVACSSRSRLGSGTPLSNTPLATTPSYQPHAETRTCYRDPDVSNGYHFVYLHEFFTALQATHGSDGFFFLSMD